MKQITVTEEKSAERIFSNSIYRNTHLGCLDLEELPETGGSILLDESDSTGVLMGFQPAADNIVWLHSFYCSHDPKGYALAAALKHCGLARPLSIYTISSHLWYSSLLKQNGFRENDEIIQLETADIRIPEKVPAVHSFPFPTERAEAVRKACEKAFPPLWRQNTAEFEKTCRLSNYRRFLSDGSGIYGYLLADITEDNCHIMRIAIDPEQQNRGLASALINEMIRYSKGIGITNFSVNTNKNDLPAVGFYNSLEFKKTGDVFPVFNKYI